MRPFEDDFKSLNDMLLEMGSLVAHSVQRSVLSLVEKNEDYAHQVIRDESRVDQGPPSAARRSRSAWREVASGAAAISVWRMAATRDAAAWPTSRSRNVASAVA